MAPKHTVCATCNSQHHAVTGPFKHNVWLGPQKHKFLDAQLPRSCKWHLLMTGRDPQQVLGRRDFQDHATTPCMLPSRRMKRPTPSSAPGWAIHGPPLGEGVGSFIPAKGKWQHIASRYYLHEPGSCACHILAPPFMRVMTSQHQSQLATQWQLFNGSCASKLSSF